jgi:hypothetical protein
LLRGKIAICFIQEKPVRLTVMLFASFLPAFSVFSWMISVPDNFARLAAQEDTVGDKKITIHNHITPFEILGTNGAPVETVRGEYPLSILLQHLKRAEDEGRFQIPLSEIPFGENIVDRTHRLTGSHEVFVEYGNAGSGTFPQKTS